MATYPLPTLAAKVTAAGISAPSYNDILLSLEATMRSIYGEDIYLGADSQDGQLLAILARAVSDCNDGVIAAYNSFSPLTAVGVGLSNMVKINGIARDQATNSTVDVTLSGAVGTTVNNGKVRDTSGQTWLLPPSVTITSPGTITVTATAEQPGEVRAEAHTVTVIGTPVLGWNSVDNATAATVGAPVETDAQLRDRQSRSVALGSTGMLAALQAAVDNVAGVDQVKVYENSTGSTDANGIPAHSIAVVVTGGDNTEIATAIMNKRSPGVGMYGSTTVNVTDAVGQVQAIKFTRPTLVTIKVDMEVHGLTGYTTADTDAIKAALVDYFNSLPSDQDVYWSRTFLPVLTLPNSSKFEINYLKLYRDSDPHLQDDVNIGFGERPRGILANVTVAVV